jgi:hypothetical protein
MVCAPMRAHANRNESARAVRRLGGARAPGDWRGGHKKHYAQGGARKRDAPHAAIAASHNVFLWPLAGIPASSPASTRTTCAANRRHHSALNQTPPAPQVRPAPAPRGYTLPLGCRRTALGGGDQRCAQAHASRETPAPAGALQFVAPAGRAGWRRLARAGVAASRLHGWNHQAPET